MFINEEILKVTSAENIGNAEQFAGVSTDSRKLSEGDLFVALRGDKFDGHKFAETAVKNGAVAILADHKLDVDVPQYIVENTLAAYQQLARCHRIKMNVPVIGITGTNGKTTVKEMINSILSSVANPLCSEANFNNHIGVPATLLKIKKEHTHAIIEMGMNHPGEIKTLSNIAMPDVAVITSIGKGHIEFLGSVEAIVSAKLEILEGLSKEGTIILPFNSEYFGRMKETALNFGIKKIISFGNSEDADFSFITEKSDEKGSAGMLITPFGNAKAKINIAGRHNCENAAAAAAAVMCAEKEIIPEEIASAFTKLKSVNMRCQIITINGAKIILDCYNANPDSMRAAIDLLTDLETSGKKIAFIGDMLELGSESEKYHKEAGAYAAEKNIDLIITTGEYSDFIVSGAKEKGMADEKCHKFEIVDKLTDFLTKNIKSGDVVLVKASRRAKFEEIIKMIMDRTEK